MKCRELGVIRVNVIANIMVSKYRTNYGLQDYTLASEVARISCSIIQYNRFLKLGEQSRTHI